MVFDWDDQSEANNALPWLYRLKEINPAFKATLFAVPALGSDAFWESHPDWIELAVHGWDHHSVYECAGWTHEQLRALLDHGIVRKHFTHGFKAPGWQISDACYEVLLERGWWVADQHLEDGRRPPGLPVYFYEDGHWHGHSHNVCGNGIEETWEQVVELVRATTEFAWASEAARIGAHPVRP